MNNKKVLLCDNCRKRVTYKILERSESIVIKGIEIKYIGQYGVCDECGADIYVPGLYDKNAETVDNLYRKAKGIITIPEIKKALEKSKLSEKELSKSLGFEESTITKYLDGLFPTKENSDVLFEILDIGEI